MKILILFLALTGCAPSMSVLIREPVDDGCIEFKFIDGECHCLYDIKETDRLGLKIDTIWFTGSIPADERYCEKKWL